MELLISAKLDKQRRRILVLLYVNFFVWTAVWMSGEISYGVYQAFTIVPAALVVMDGLLLYIAEMRGKLGI